MVKKRTLWIFGQSQCLPYDLADKNFGWDKILSIKLGCAVKNLAKAGADNLFIFYSILEHIQSIKTNDIVVVGWSHPSRKTFILNQKQSKKLKNSSIVYDTHKHLFFRSKGHPVHSIKDTMHKWFSMKPKQSGIGFYDTWFRDYYNMEEQKINFQSYIWSVDALMRKATYVPFYFSADSIKDLKNVSKKMCMAEFVKANRVAISNSNAHMNLKGHRLWAKKIYKEIKHEIE